MFFNIYLGILKCFVQERMMLKLNVLYLKMFIWNLMLFSNIDFDAEYLRQ